MELYDVESSGIIRGSKRTGFFNVARPNGNPSGHFYHVVEYPHPVKRLGSYFAVYISVDPLIARKIPLVNPWHVTFNNIDGPVQKIPSTFSALLSLYPSYHWVGWDFMGNTELTEIEAFSLARDNFIRLIQDIG